MIQLCVSGCPTHHTHKSVHLTAHSPVCRCVYVCVCVCARARVRMQKTQTLTFVKGALEEIVRLVRSAAHAGCWPLVRLEERGQSVTRHGAQLVTAAVLAELESERELRPQRGQGDLAVVGWHMAWCAFQHAEGKAPLALRSSWASPIESRRSLCSAKRACRLCGTPTGATGCTRQRTPSGPAAASAFLRVCSAAWLPAATAAVRSGTVGPVARRRSARHVCANRGLERPAGVPAG
jgi:hypothetical protein